MATTGLTTLRVLLDHAVSRFASENLCFGHGYPTAVEEARALLRHALRLPAGRLGPFLDAELMPAEVAAALEVIERRAVERVPAAYLTGEAWVGAYRFVIDERVLVPRSLLAELIPHRFSPWIPDPDRVTSILDLCTGSGYLAIMLADAFPGATIDAIDISAGALEVARRNFDDHGLRDRITLTASDLYANVPRKSFDLITANPPYVTAASMETMADEYRHEPSLALAGGVDGMDLVRPIVAGAAACMKSDGVLVVEVGTERSNAEAALPHLDLTWLPTSAGDSAVFLLRASEPRSQDRRGLGR